MALDGWFYPRQAVAVTVERELRTVCSWEAKGWLPRSPLYQSGIIDMTDPDTLPHGVEDLRGRRYVYTAPMLTDLRTIAAEHGVLDGPVNLAGTDFPSEVRAAWDIPEPEPEVIVARPLTPDELANRHRTGHIVDFSRSWRDHDTRRPLRDW